MPRKSAASLSVVAVEPGSNRPRPPANLRGPERNLFIELIAANPPQHFRLSDRPLLTQYVAAASHDITVLKMHWCRTQELRSWYDRQHRCRRAWRRGRRHASHRVV